MHLRNQAEQRLFSKRLLSGLLIALVSVLLLRSAFLPGAESQRAVVINSFHLPIQELSGVTAVRLPTNQVRYAAIGDRSSELVMFDLADDFSSIEITAAFDFSSQLVAKFSLCGLSTSAGCMKLRKQVASDWEAMHASEDGTLYIIQEHSSAIVSFRVDNPYDLKLSNLETDFGNKMLAGTEQFLNVAANKDPNLVEGFVVLDDETILASKENNPAMIMKFIKKPANDRSDRDIYSQAETWVWSDKGCDISDLKVDENGDVFILSQTCRKITKLEPLDRSLNLAKTKMTWYLPSKVKNPEALELLPGNYFMVGSDRKSTKKPNIFIVKPEL